MRPDGTDEPAAPHGDGGLVRLRLDLAYDGTAYAGWARQPGQPTIQGAAEEALERVLRVPAALTVAGRTDAGVHARGQVAHADVPSGALAVAGGPAALHRRLLGVLPADIRVTAVTVAPAGFEARFSAERRRYAYRVSDDPSGPDPLRRHDTAAHPRPLDLDRLRRAGAGLLGEHDFAAYCRRRPGATTIRTLLRLEWERGADGVLTATVEADAFCHGMVRSLVGALLLAGDGRRPVDWPAELLAGAVRVPDGQVAPACGLTLLAVTYPDAAELATRAAATRSRRGVPSP
ncbi:MAG: tRNA pseudouridine(38-40) synthase TruA [Actinomycetota bacterium]|nr:tRNA pseudouridine(38-40) synthase TruA [Actinomycetota bacterium]